MKPKAKTLIERHGFLDPDRDLSKHDEIQLWTYSNMLTILESFLPERQMVIRRKEMEHPITQEHHNYKNIIGFVDIHVLVSLKDVSVEDNMVMFSVEVKNKIPSCGELIRQINFYRRFETTRSRWIVVSPDDRFEFVLAEQGIGFYKYKSQGQLF